MESIQSAATECPGFQRVVPINRDDEKRVEAIERELIKLGSETSMDVVQYSLVNWEQAKGESQKSIRVKGNVFDNIHKHIPLSLSLSLSLLLIELKSGQLRYKSTTKLGLSSWKQAFFKLTGRDTASVQQ